MNQHAIRSGAIIGIISVVISLIIYMIDGSLFAAWWLNIGLMVLGLALVVYFGIQHRNEEGGYLAFGKAWMYSMQTFVIAGLIGTIFNILLFQVVDPDLAEVVTEKAIENSVAVMERFNTPPDAMEKAIEDTRTSMMDRFTVVGSIKGYGWAILIYAFISLITGAIIKRNEPETL